MSRLQDIIEETRAETPDEDEEAAEVEEAETTPETPDDDDGQAETPAPPGADPVKLERELKRHEKAMTGLLGPAFEDMERCLMCEGLGYTPSAFEPAPQLQPHPTLVTCRTCDGFGVLATPSKNPQYATEPCIKCSGRGSVEGATYAQLVPPNAPQPFAGAPMPPPQPQWDQARGIWLDQFGAPIGHPSGTYAASINGPGTP
jgi:hypothetical protein